MESYTIYCSNRSFGRIVRFSYESVQDSKKTSLLQQTVGTWNRQVPITKEKFYSKFFNKGAYTAGYDSIFDNTITGVCDDPSGDLIYDNKSFFNSAHPDKVGNTYGNASASNTLTHCRS